ncbi:MAG: nickel-dependent hydrogenase large subunit [Deltaproteobacteria bacterium]|nr:nickel-dependent hydrogenase large subunit [Deltaproteobacteria bacterium]
MSKIVIDPVTRIEGHLKIEVTVDGGRVREARASGTLFRGFEIFLRGRDPLDAQRITQRVCGVCPTAHATASSRALDDAFGVKDAIPENGRLLRNLIFGCNYIQSHVLHFYHLAALDFVDVAAAADHAGEDLDLASIRGFIGRGALGPFLPREEGDFRLSKEDNRRLAAHYVEALKVRRMAHEMLAIWGGKMPHSVGIVPGGVTQGPTTDRMANFLGKLQTVREFIEHRYIPDVLTVAKAYPDYFEIGAGCGKYLAYGVFDAGNGATHLVGGTTDAALAVCDVDAAKITESVTSSWLAGETLHPSEGRTEPDVKKAGAHSFIKAPRYDGAPHEVGPLARALAAYVRGAEPVKTLVDEVLSALGAEPKALFSTLGRHAARAIETKIVADAMVGWLTKLVPGEPHCAEFKRPKESRGCGLTDAPRGALGHWIRIEDGKIADYQLVVPTTWNASPQDERGQPGPIEQALVGTKVKDAKSPVELLRIVRSFDPCLACAVHAVSPKGRMLGEFRVA